jgi:hypothetical protein
MVSRLDDRPPPEWEEVLRLPGLRRGDPERVWRATESPVPSADGYRIVWIHSTAKTAADEGNRLTRIQAGIRALEDVARRLSGARPRFRTVAAVEAAANAAVTRAGASRWLRFEVTERTEEQFHKISRNYRGYRRRVVARFDLTWSVAHDRVAADARSDGCFPLITNDRSLTSAEVLAAHRYQPHLERRHAHLKGPLEVVPMWLKDAGRIEALLLCEYVAQLVHALIEREIRRAMAAHEITELALYPEGRSCSAPTAPRVLDIFDGLHRDLLIQDGEVVEVFDPQVDPLQSTVLKLLGIRRLH